MWCVHACTSLLARNARDASGVYPAANPAGNLGTEALGEAIMQTAQPRDIGALALVVGVFLVLFVLSLMLGSPTR
jgi:hypothetical protein